MILGKGARELFGLFRHFFVSYPLRSTLTIVLMTTAALAEGFGVASLLPLINLVVEPEFAQSTLTVYVAQAFTFVGLEPSIGGLLIVIVVMISLKSLLVMLAMTQVGYSAARVAMNMRLEVVRALLNARWQHFVDQRTGELASAVSNEPLRTANAYVSVCRALAVAFQLVIYLALSFVISWEISIAAIVVGVVAMFALNRLVGMSSRAGRAQTELQKSFMTRLLQGLEGMKPLKAMAREGSFFPMIEASVRGLNRAQRRIVVSVEAVSESHEIIRVLAVAGGLYVFLSVWSHPIDSLLVLMLLFARTLQKASFLQHSYQAVAIDVPAFIFLRSTITSAEEEAEPNLTGERPRFTSAIMLRDVSFSYGSKKVLDRVSMLLPSGKFIAIVGASGVGKTTIADLVIGLLRPQDGDVWIDDLPMRDIDMEAWRGMIGYVPQETFLFHDTIMVNVTLGNPEISPTQVESALRRAGAWEFIAVLPEGIDTVVGERGARLSGGQRQRIAIARALIRDPSLLILDEATTALDPEMEAGIVDTVRRLTGRITVLSISHQPALKRAADIIYSVGDGGIVVETRHDGPVAPLTTHRHA